jgi:SAM-dependent methyltransferase
MSVSTHVAARAQQMHRLARLRDEADSAATDFASQYEDDVAAYRVVISDAINENLRRLQDSVQETSAGSQVCAQLVKQSAEYVDWLQWSLWDLPYFAVAVRPPMDHFRAAVGACALTYLSARVFDDVVDRHFWYKGRHPTLLQMASQSFPGSQGVEGMTVLGGLLICFEGLLRLTAPEEPRLNGLAPLVVKSLRRALIGAVMERSAPREWTPDFYQRLVQLKNVDYWRSLFVALDPESSSSLYPFLERYYVLAQYLNDVHDFAEDSMRGQPNIVSLYLSDGHEGPGSGTNQQYPGRAVPEELESRLGETFLELGGMARVLPELERQIAQLKLSESLREADRLGLFGSMPDVPSHGSRENHISRGLHWHAEISQVIERAGSEALERVTCPACGEGKPNYLFQKQGFSYHRCSGCSHIYVSPRIRGWLQAEIAADFDGLWADPYLEYQRTTAAAICKRLYTLAPGPRLLDIGFGRGYVLHAARAYGFETFGMDSSETSVRSLEPQFGNHVFQGTLGDHPIPSGPFDAIVMSHVLEHLSDPLASLREVRDTMTPGAILYIAVPDMDSMQFRIFGKKWDVISPLVHFQYFTSRSLEKLLDRCGLRDTQRNALPVSKATTSRRGELIRQLGGTDAGELAMIARNPRDGIDA